MVGRTPDVGELLDSMPDDEAVLKLGELLLEELLLEDKVVTAVVVPALEDNIETDDSALEI